MKLIYPYLLRLCAALLALPCGFAADVLTYHNDASRTGLNSDELALTPATVNANAFGLKFNAAVAGQVYAQPLYASSVPVYQAGVFQGRHNLVIVATEQDNVYAFDADSGALLWNASLLGPNEAPADAVNCADLVPNNGITGTPVIDRAMLPYGRLYLVAMSQATGTGAYVQRLHALDLASGQEVAGSPVPIQATCPGAGPGSDGNGNVVFDPGKQRQRAALLLANRTLYIAWGSFCDPHVLPYSGWILGYDEATLAQTQVFNANPNGVPTSTDLPDGSGNGIWGAGGGLAASTDNPALVYALTGNGPFDDNLVNGFPSNGDYGDTFLKLSPSLGVLDYFTPFTQASLAATDKDYGSGGVLILPGLRDANNAVRHLAVACGKDTNLYLLDRDNLGKYTPGASANAIYQELDAALPGGLFSTPAYFNSAVYFGPNNRSLRRFVLSKARLRNPPASATATVFGYPGTTPSISAFGTANAVVWACERTSGASPGNAVLHAYNALNLATELYNSTQNAARDTFGAGAAVKFATPTVCNGHVYVGTANGLAGFGLLLPTTAGDVSGSVQLTFSKFTFQSSNKTYKQTVTLLNTGTAALPLPLSVVFDGVSPNASLYNGNGATSATLPAASGYVNAPLSAPLAPGQSTSVVVYWIDANQPPSAAGITYGAVRVLAGLNAR